MERTDRPKEEQAPDLLAFLRGCPVERGVRMISEPRPFQHPEEKYDEQYANDLELKVHAEEGKGLLELCEDFGYDAGGPILEIGCGTGRLSLSLVLSAGSRPLLLTDPSPAFCEITLRKLGALSRELPHVNVAVLLAEDIGKLPKNTFSAIMLRSVLHHVLDVARFLRDCSEILAPGGVLLFEEPCTEGYLLMGAITQYLPAVFRSQGIAVSEKHLADIQLFADAMIYYARRDLDKSAAEDKHLFRPEELGRICRKCNMDLEFFSNRSFSDIRERHTPLPEDYFEKFYYNYAKYALSWDGELLDLLDRHARGYLKYFSPLAKCGGMPPTYGAFLCKKAAS
jgi:ubiquinone/menaquinone biosynthesis C-methylase UbiE